MGKPLLDLRVGDRITHRVDGRGVKGTVVLVVVDGSHGIVAWEVPTLGLWFGGFETELVVRV